MGILQPEQTVNGFVFVQLSAFWYARRTKRSVKIMERYERPFSLGGGFEPASYESRTNHANSFGTYTHTHTHARARAHAHSHVQSLVCARNKYRVLICLSRFERVSVYVQSIIT